MNILRRLKDPSRGRNRSELWLGQARFDLEAAKISFDSRFFEWAAYQSEQAVEKALKAVILDAGFFPPKIHKLGILIGYCNKVNPAFKNTKFDFRNLDSFTFISRYPFAIPGRHLVPHELISGNDARSLLEQAKDFVKKIEHILSQGVKVNHETSQAYEFEIEDIDLKKRLDSVIDAMVSSFDVQKIVLFGAYAKEFLPRNATTIDLLIVANTTEDFVSRIQKARMATKGGQPSIEPLVYTPEEFKFMTEEEGEGLLEMALEEGKLLFEKGKGKILDEL